jgi:hypothetical protein
LMSFLTVSSFGWVNSSYIIGLKLLPDPLMRKLESRTPWKTVAKQSLREQVTAFRETIKGREHRLRM